MDNFVVSARKYRPATFDTVVGQSSITNTLKNAIKNQHLAQAFLFCGPRGVGKTTCARILAKTINCENLSDNMEACDVCESCTSFNSSASFNIHELDAASNNSVDDIRNLVDQVRVPPQVGNYKVYIIDEVHMLSQQAFNAFLKTLEEPPPYAKFILATTEKHKIIPTILSRCQIFDFKRITVEDIAKHLKFVAESENVVASEDALHVIAQKADGALRDALSMFDQLVSFAGNELDYQSVIQNLNVLDYDYYFRVIQHILNGDVSGTLLIINDILENGFDGQHFIIGLGEHLRNLLVSKDPKTVDLLEVSDKLKKRYLDQSGLCDMAFLLRALSINNQYDVQYKTSSNKRLNLELSLLQMCGLMGLPTKQNPVAEKAAILPSPDSKPKAPALPKEEKKEEVIAVKKEVIRPEPKPVKEEIKKENPAPVQEVKKTEAEEVKKKPYKSPDDDIAGHLSIKQTSKMLNGNNDKVDDPEANFIPRTKNVFSQEDLQAAWLIGIPEICKNSQNMLSSLKSRNPILKEDFKIEVTADNMGIENQIKDLKQEILDYLRKSLNNDHIQLITKLADIKEQQDKAYFPDEIYKKMVEKHPEVKNMRDQLNLEIDF